MPIRRLVACALAVLGCQGPAQPPPDPDVLVVVLDTLRQDRVGAYGYARDTTPVLDGLAARGTRYAEARSTSSWTSPAHGSLFTGLQPATHGATQEKWDLSPDLVTLAEILDARGYQTIAAVGNPMLAKQRGFSQGFDQYFEGWRGKKPAEGGGGTTDRGIVRWLVGKLGEPADHPRFVFVNLIGIHSPYDSCGDSCGRYGASLDGGVVDNGWQDVYLGRVQHDAAAVARLSDLYDAEVHEADALLGEIVQAFEASSDRPDLVVVTSDHGENIGDHGHFDHVFSLYESVVRVPLVVVGEGFDAGAVDPSPVQLHDVFPTVLRGARVPLDEHASQGLPLDLVPDDRTALLDYHKPVQATRILLGRATDAEKARLDPWQHHLRGIVEGPLKLVSAEDGFREVYDLATDPREENDLAPERPVGDLDALLARRFDEIGKAMAGGETQAVDAETKAALEAIGYLE